MANDPSTNWRLLAPHRPLGPGDPAYVARPAESGHAIATWVLAGGNTVLVSGPTGAGKSTELAQAKKELEAERVTCLVQVDRATNIHKLTADVLLALLALELVKQAREQGLAISEGLQGATKAVAARVSKHHNGPSVMQAAMSEVSRLAHPRRIALLIDGLERLVVGASPEIFDALSQLEDSVDLIVVIPWHAAFGGSTQHILRSGEKLHRVLALETEPPAGVAAAAFLGRVLARRLFAADIVPEPLMPLLGSAFTLSGGIPRTFLQLMADAGTYARVKRGDDYPNHSDLADAARDQQDSFRRALLPGDATAIGSVVGTDGRELDLDRRIRLLAQGILLERIRDGRVVLKAHPLVAPILQEQRA